MGKPNQCQHSCVQISLGIAMCERPSLFVEQRECLQLPFVASLCDLPSLRYSLLEITRSFSFTVMELPGCSSCGPWTRPGGVTLPHVNRASKQIVTKQTLEVSVSSTLLPLKPSPQKYQWAHPHHRATTERRHPGLEVYNTKTINSLLCNKLAISCNPIIPTNLILRNLILQANHIYFFYFR